jgi:hypothetical protein
MQNVSFVMGAIVVKFSGDQTFDHLDEVVVRLINLFFLSDQFLGGPLGVLRGCF